MAHDGTKALKRNTKGNVKGKTRTVCDIQYRKPSSGAAEFEDNLVERFPGWLAGDLAASLSQLRA